MRVMGLSPGTVATEMQREIKKSGINPVSQLDWEDHIPPDWPAKALLWMCSPEADAHHGHRDQPARARDPRRRWASHDQAGQGRRLWRHDDHAPDKANSLTEAMLTELAEIAEAAREARVFVLTGEGARCFQRRGRSRRGARGSGLARSGSGFRGHRGAAGAEHRGAQRHAGGRGDGHGAGLRPAHRGAQAKASTR
jgi:hypothetical protein